MAYIGGDTQGPIDFGGRDDIWQLKQDVAELQRQVAELLAARDETPDTVGAP